MFKQINLIGKTASSSLLNTRFFDFKFLISCDGKNLCQHGCKEYDALNIRLTIVQRGKKQEIHRIDDRELVVSEDCCIMNNSIF